jgi:hypothetical protein
MPATYQNIIITEEILNSEPNAFFVYGDNVKRIGLGGAAKLRNHPRAIGFVTKKEPTNNQGACFTPEEYAKPFFDQLDQLSTHIKNGPNNKFYISKLGSGLANRYWIWERVISHNLQDELGGYDNVVFCWDQNDENFNK